MPDYSMPAESAAELITALTGNSARVCVGGGWAVDALLGEQTRPHSDLDLWVAAADAEALFATFAANGLDRVFPWPGDRPWNFVLHDGRTRRVDLHFYERVAGRLQYGSAADPFLFDADDIDGRGTIAGAEVVCDSPRFALQCHTGYPPRDTDRHDVVALCERFGMPLPDGYR